VVAAFRSIETRRPQVRATTTGISAIITATGELAEVAGVHERAALVGTVTPETRATTLMLAWGDWLGPTALGLGVALLMLRLAGRRGSRAEACSGPGPASRSTSVETRARRTT
jgi:apolipoprotein N-acyltransferase